MLREVGRQATGFSHCRARNSGVHCFSDSGAGRRSEMKSLLLLIINPYISGQKFLGFPDLLGFVLSVPKSLWNF